MFTPELSNVEKGEFVLLANHALGSLEQVSLSVAYNKARVAFGRGNVPKRLEACRVVYDIRGQAVAEPVLAGICEQLAGVTVEFRR